MSAQHTSEPWSYQASIPEEGYECFWINSGSRQISSFDGPQNEEQFSNVRRIVACVNACAGYTTEELEQATLDKRHRHEIIADLVKSNKQRDELLAALEQFCTWGRMQHKAQSKGCHATFDMMQLRDEIELAESAIASVKANTQ